MRVFTRGNNLCVVAKQADNTPPEQWPSTELVAYDGVLTVKNDALDTDGRTIRHGSLVDVAYLAFAPPALQALYAHVSVSPGTNGSVSDTSGLSGAPNNQAGSTLIASVDMRFGPDAADPIFAITGAFQITLRNTTGDGSAQIRLEFVNGHAEYSFITDGKPSGLWTIDDSNFAALPVYQNDIDAAGIDGDPGLWSTNLVQPVFFDVWE